MIMMAFDSKITEPGSLNHEIEWFIDNISKGPFRCLKDKPIDLEASDYVVNRNKIYKKNSVREGINSSFEEDIYNLATYQGYLDMCRRMSKIDKNKKEILLNMISEALRVFFTENKKDNPRKFDQWVEDLFINIKNETGVLLNVGKYQKVLNMAFKYLYCCEDIRESKVEYFNYCHMVLDGFTLAWYRSCFKKEQIRSWSTIDDYECYIGIQVDIRNHLKEPFASEFLLWHMEKELAEEKEFQSIAKKIKDRKELRNELEHSSNLSIAIALSDKRIEAMNNILERN